MRTFKCPICSSSMSTGLKKWHRTCPECGYESADLIARINSADKELIIDEGFRETGLIKLRKKNFNLLLDQINKCKPSGGRLLDVGCAHGWFLEMAKTKFHVKGLEPDIEIFCATKKRGLDVENGYFPDALDENEKFDLILFNDVFEHIPNIDDVMQAIKTHLNQDGFLVINLPSSDGFFYKLSKILSRVGLGDAFERMWQKGLPSPHLHYFNPKNLNIFLTKHGFMSKCNGSLASVSLDGLFTRIKYARKWNLLSIVLIYVVVLILIPLLSLLPKDISYVIASKSVDDPQNEI